MTEEQVKASNEFLKQHPDLTKEYKNESKKSSTKKTLALSNGPAPKLSSYSVYFVAKSRTGDNYTGENISSGQSTTKNDYNGTVYVLTKEIGYGSERSSFSAGNRVSLDKVITLDFDGDRIVDGFIDVWKIDNVTTGTFSSKSSSTNSVGSISTKITIK